VVSTRLPTTFGDFEAVGYRSLVDEKHHVARSRGTSRGERRARARALGVPDGRRVPLAALRLRGAAGIGAVDDRARGSWRAAVPLPGGARIGLLNKLRAYRLQEDGLDTVEANERLGLPADLRDYGIGAQILVDLGLTSIRILTNNPKKIRGLEGYGLSVSGQIPIEHAPNEHNAAYMRTKAERMGHILHHQGLNVDEEMLRSERAGDAGGAPGAGGHGAEGGQPR